MPETVYLSLGSNIEPAANLVACVRSLAERVTVLAASPVYRSAAVGRPDQDPFMNAALHIETELSVTALKADVLAPVEDELGRVRSDDPFGPRTIDIDIALYNREVCVYDERRLPDPDILRHAHVARPLADLAPTYVHPVTQQTLAEIAAGLDCSALIPRQDVELPAQGRKEEQGE